MGVEMKGLLFSPGVNPVSVAPVGPFWGEGLSAPFQVAAIISPCPDLIFCGTDSELQALKSLLKQNKPRSPSRLSRPPGGKALICSLRLLSF